MSKLLDTIESAVGEIHDDLSKHAAFQAFWEQLTYQQRRELVLEHKRIILTAVTSIVKAQLERASTVISLS